MTSDLDEVDMVYKMWDWLETASISGGDRLQQLVELLNTFEKVTKTHFDREEKALFNFYNKRGAKDYSSTLIEEHKEITRMFEALYQKIEVLQKGERNSREHQALESEIRNGLGEFLTEIQRHATQEEDIFLQSLIIYR